MKDVIIFDTNALRHTGLNKFLGSRETLRQLLPDAEFFIPEIVLEEIHRQKIRQFEEDKKKLTSNSLLKTFSTDLSAILDLDIHDYLQNLQKNESFSFEVIPCVQGEIVDGFRDMALDNQAPFEKTSDKGFKDACIYVSILRFLKKSPEISVFFWGKDGRLKTAFEEHPEITVVESVEEYHQVSARHLFDEYFLGVLSEEIGEDIEENMIINSWKNRDDNWVLTLDVNSTCYLVEIDSRQVSSKIEVVDLEGEISTLVESGSFTKTHQSVEELTPYIPYFSSAQISLINQGVKENPQISLISSDADVEEFLRAINQ